MNDSEKSYMEVPSLIEIEVTQPPSLVEIAEISIMTNDGDKNLLLDALVEKAERKGRKKKEKEKRAEAKLQKQLRLLEKEEAAAKRRAEKNCPYTGKRAWRAQLYALKSRNIGGGGGGGGSRVLDKRPPPSICEVCGKRPY